MDFDDAKLKGPHQRAMVRILRVVLPDEEKWQGAVRDALQAAKKTELPEDAAELLQFVKTYLGPELRGLVGPNLVLALYDDLAAEIEPPRSGGTSGSSRMRAVSPLPPAGESRPPVDSMGSTSSRPPEARTNSPEVGGPVRFPKLKQAVAKLVRTASTKLRAVSSGVEAQGEPSGFARRRVNVLLVDSDQLARSSLARALVNAKFDVSVRDTTSQILEAMLGLSGRVVAIVNTKEDGIDAGLRAVTEVHPDLPVVAWSEALPDIEESLLAGAGVRRFTVVSKTASSADVVDAIRKFLAQLDRRRDE